MSKKPSDYFKNSPPADFTGIPEFKDTSEALAWASKNRWGKTPLCPSCGKESKKTITLANGVIAHRCSNASCKTVSFHALTGTALSGTNLPLHYWLFAAREHNKGAAGMTLNQLTDALQISFKSSFDMYKRLRQLYENNQAGILGEFAPTHGGKRKPNHEHTLPDAIPFGATIPIPAKKKFKKLCKDWAANKSGKKWGRTTISIKKLIKMFDDDDAARFFTDLRWGNGVKCPNCGTSKIHKCNQAGHFRCYNKECKRNHFNYKTNTPMMYSNIGALIWLESMYEITLARQGSSALEFMNRQELSYKAIFYLLHRLRLMSACPPDGTAMGPLEVDEVFIRDKSAEGDGSGERKHTVIMGARCRTTGKIFVECIKDLNSQTALDFVNRCTGGKKVVVFTDGWTGYRYSLPQYGHHHEFTNHQQGVYAHPSAWQFIIKKGDEADEKIKGNFVHNNSVETIWRQLRDALRGVYRKISNKYLMAYMTEVAFRLSEGRVTRDIGNRIAAMYLNGIGRGTTYAKMVAAT